MINLPKLIGHRGVKNLAPENTIESIKLAKQLGLKWVEIDVKVSKDLIPILLHDDTLERTANNKEFPNKLNYRNIKKLDAGLFFYNKITNIYIPTLSEILLFCSNNNIGLNIELKPNLDFRVENNLAIAKLFSTFPLNIQYYFSSFDLESLISMKKIIPNAYYGFLVDEFTHNLSIDDIIKTCSNFNFFSCGLDKNIINSDIIDKMKKQDLIITSYSQENFTIKEANELWEKGVKSIFIDDPIGFKIY